MLQGRFVIVSVDSCKQRPLRRPFRFTDSDKVNLQRAPAARCRATLTRTYLKKPLIKIANRGRERRSGTHAEKMYPHSEAKCFVPDECLTFCTALLRQTLQAIFIIILTLEIVLKTCYDASLFKAYTEKIQGLTAVLCTYLIT